MNFNLAHETNENLQHMPVLGIVGRRVRDVVYSGGGGAPYKPQRSSPSQTMSNRAKRLLNFLLMSESVRSILSVTLHLARDEE